MDLFAHPGCKSFTHRYLKGTAFYPNNILHSKRRFWLPYFLSYLLMGKKISGGDLKSEII